MCLNLTRSDEQNFGIVLGLCADFVGHTLKHLDMIEAIDQGPAKAVLRAFTPQAALLVIEPDYFDLDYRSEFSITHETSFTAREPQTPRLHFFSAADGQRPAEGRLRDLVSSHKNGYLGYVIIRPQEPSTIGRSILSPLGRSSWLREPQRLERHVRTAVPEQVELFGVSLVAIGVPFMEQDGHLLRCAHVSAWACHFTGVLRGAVARRPSAQFHLSEDSTASYGRPYPSEGLTASALGRILRKLDLPPEVIDDKKLRKPRDLQWHDRPDLWAAVAAAGADQRQLDRLWRSENLTAGICRYLNSGFPSVLSREQLSHTQVVCGYLRRGDLSEDKAAQVGAEDEVSDVVAFLVQDDQRGPYRTVPVHRLLQEMEPPYPSWGLSVLVPLPVGLWLSGSVAESQGAVIFPEVLAQRLQSLPEWANGRLTRTEAARHHAILESLVEQTAGNVGELAIRSFAITGSDFKYGLSKRLASANADLTVGYTPLPKYVWVVELVDRQLRKQQKAAVRATLVLDASAVSDGSPNRAPSPLLIHIPGQIARIMPDVFEDKHWSPTGVGPYMSGRWNHQRDWVLSPDRMAARSKGAVPTSSR